MVGACQGWEINLPDDDDLPTRASARLTILPLDALGLEELDAYVTDLRAEISRVEAAMTRKRSHRTVADAVFGRRSTDNTT